MHSVYPNPRRRQSFFCLLTFLAYLLLPLAHQWTLPQCAHRSCCAPAGATCCCGPVGAASAPDRLSLPPAPGESHRPHHDRTTCPLCQAALGQVKYAITSPPTILSGTLANQDFCPQKPDSVSSAADYLLIASRAPPTSPLT